MKSLKIEHLAPYIPYIRMLDLRDCSAHILPEQRTCGLRHVLDGNTPLSHICTTPESMAWKPILRPMSNLIEEIEHNGETFIPIDRLFEEEHPAHKVPEGREYNHQHFILEYRASHSATARHTDVKKRDTELNPYWMMRNLFKWHFDTFGLIDAGLAIERPAKAEKLL